MAKKTTPLSDAVVLVTGGGRGLGKATALAFARAECAAVVVVARTSTQIDAVAAEVRTLGAEGLALSADVTDGAMVRRTISEVIDRFGRLDILVNNAGSFPVGPIRDFSEEEWDQAVAIDLKSFYLCSRAALIEGQMLERHSGHIINIGSVSVRRQIPNMSVHSALKAGLLSLSESLRRELAGQKIKVSLICPGTINTGLVQSDVARSYVHDRDKWLEPEDVADLIVYVAERRREVNISEVTIVGL